MKKISNEVKVGVITFLTILVFIWLYNFLKGKDLFSNTAYYYTVYENIGGLAESSPVEINGYKVGVVQSIDLLDAESGKLIVAFSVNRNFKLPQNSIAEIIPVSLLGGMKVHFIFGDGPGFYSEDDTIPGQLAVSIIDKMEKEIVPIREKATNLINVLDSVLNSINEVLDDDFKNDFSNTLSNLNSTTKSLDNIIGSKEKDLKATLENIDKFTLMLSENSENMSKTFKNLESITDTLASADIYSSISNLKVSLEKAAIMIDNMNNGKGSAGQFMTNDTLYLNLTKSLESLDILLQDMKADPKKYVHFSIFGRKSTTSH
jgi:phospholipid/cholesterol/gamma-HCH transport system substrate-binding protein